MKINMIIGKDSAKKGFTWFGKTALKAVTAIAAIGLSFPHQSFYPIVLVVAIGGFALIAYEGYKEYKSLEN